MIYRARLIVVLDTNVIYPVIIRDLLFWFAHYDLYIPKWSNHIFDEWKSVMLRIGVSIEESEKRIQKANLAFPHALVKNYEHLIGSFELPDEKDRHVVAAAIKCNAHLIVTNNVKDFPNTILGSLGIKIKTTDEFLSDIICLDPEIALDAFHEMVSCKKNPSINENEVIQQMRRVGLISTANAIQSLTLL